METPGVGTFRMPGPGTGRSAPLLDGHAAQSPFVRTCAGLSAIRAQAHSQKAARGRHYIHKKPPPTLRRSLQPRLGIPNCIERTKNADQTKDNDSLHNAPFLSNKEKTRVTLEAISGKVNRGPINRHCAKPINYKSEGRGFFALRTQRPSGPAVSSPSNRDHVKEPPQRP